MKDEQDHFDVLRKIQQNPESTQRELAEELGFSLGKLNYCLKALQTKGLVKIENFKKNPNKLNYFYVLTPKGISEKTKLTLNYMKRKMKEYDELKKELKGK
tara:strand:+ start:1267 stop:1569 length:303 start_codon:yes stop_codon:yes gene_type:complete